MLTVAKEALMDERKLHMVRSELQPILIELKTTSSRVIHKRLQDVSEMVAHLLRKWNRGTSAWCLSQQLIINQEC